LGKTSDQAEKIEIDKKENLTKASSERKPLLCLGGLVPGLLLFTTIVPLTKRKISVE
jgi:hypothetical protein